MNQSQRLELISVAEMKAIDSASAAQGVPVATLMRAAGQAVAEAVAARFTARAVLVVCGPGDNGGDGWVAANALQSLGWPVRVCTLVSRVALQGAARDAADAWAGPVETSFAPDGAEIFVDAMFGAGLNRPMEGLAAEIAAYFSRAHTCVIAVDVPSGLAGDTGQPVGDACAAARCTVTFVRKKPAHVLLPGRALCGEIVLADIGAPDAVVAEQGLKLWENQPSLWLDAFPWPAIKSHKHARGHVFVASGGFGQTGAARLSARAALRIGAGLVTLLAPREAMAECAAQLTAIMLREAEGGEALASHLSAARAVVLGPAFGLTQERADALGAALAARSAPCVLDADALTLLSWRPSSWTHWLKPNDVLTPHPGEFERLFPGLLNKAPDRIEAARAAARRAGCVVLLKGPDTVIAAPDERAAVNTAGSPFLATAGSGDVLTGVIAGLMGQGMASFEAACAGAWLHGQAGERFGPGLIAEDLAEIFPSLLRDLDKIRQGREKDPL
jgi:hydroxyethylthiazole kinase-like uncharacterized protein yjeF